MEVRFRLKIAEIERFKGDIDLGAGDACQPR